MLARALIHAVSSGHTECVAAIMTAPAWQATGMQETRRRAEITLLHGAENVATIDEILKHSTDVSAADRTRDPESGYSVLHSAVLGKRQVQVICKLLKLGADPLAKDKDGQTPAALARSLEQTLIAQLLDRAAQDTERLATAGATARGIW